jgi:hypothetical protein
MEMELRRGERIKAEGERRGRPAKNEAPDEKVTQCVTLSGPEKKQRSRERELADNPKEVNVVMVNPPFAFAIGGSGSEPRETLKETSDAGARWN